ncbi:MAG: tryptophan synthase subunit alpha [Alphaproteobacteria bacterium]
MGVSRIDARFAALKGEGRSALVAFITAGDPTIEQSGALLNALPDAGADLIELGMPFSDPMADGPAIQASSLRALKAGMTLQKTLELAAAFRNKDQATPLILMGYFNPILAFGAERFAKAAAAAGVDGFIIVDLPPEEEEEFKPFADRAGLALIRLVAPTTDDQRLARVLAGTSGFVYFISITGVTGTREFDIGELKPHLERVRRATHLPIAVGFGIKTPERAAEVARLADAVVVGSAIVEAAAGQGPPGALDAKGGRAEGRVLDFVRRLSDAVRRARKKVDASS